MTGKKKEKVGNFLSRLGLLHLQEINMESSKLQNTEDKTYDDRIVYSWEDPITISITDSLDVAKGYTCISALAYWYIALNEEVIHWIYCDRFSLILLVYDCDIHLCCRHGGNEINFAEKKNGSILV